MKHETDVFKELNRRNRRHTIVVGVIVCTMTFTTLMIDAYLDAKKEETRSDNYYSRYEVTSKEEYSGEMICLVKDEVTGKEYIVIGEK